MGVHETFEMFHRTYQEAVLQVDRHGSCVSPMIGPEGLMIDC